MLNTKEQEQYRYTTKPSQVVAGKGVKELGERTDIKEQEQTMSKDDLWGGMGDDELLELTVDLEGQGSTGHPPLQVNKTPPSHLGLLEIVEQDDNPDRSVDSCVPITLDAVTPIMMGATALSKVNAEFIAFTADIGLEYEHPLPGPGVR